MESNSGMDWRRDDPLQGQAQLRANRYCIGSFLLLLTRNCNSSPFCSVHIVMSYVQFVNSFWFKIVLSDLYSLMIKRCKLHSSIPFWYCPGEALLILDSHLQNFHPTNHMSTSMKFHQL
jgi:hypothetical protein